MDETAPRSFGDLLRQLRRAAGLSQEALAERASVSARAISDLERGVRRAPYRDTIHLLAGALRLTAAERTALEAAAPRHRPPPGAIRPDPDRAAGPAVPAAPPSNLPVTLTSFIGREEELAELRRLLIGPPRRAGAVRLLTLTGAGGCGKTRLALALARAVLEERAGDADPAGAPRYPDGVWLVELAALADPLLVPGAVAAVLGVPEQPGRPLREALAEHLRERHLLLVLDNCEHLVDACAHLAEALLRASPTVQILATSREVLRAAGEVAWRVPSLGLPPVEDEGEDQEPLGVAELLDYAAVQLFTERAAAALAGFALTEENAAAVVELCRRLDGIPLALELAAARVRSLSVEQIAARLDDAFRLLHGGDRTAVARHQTLRHCVDWSYNLLDAVEQTLFVRLGIFHGGFVLEAAERVCGGDGIHPDDVLDLVTALVEKSLVQADVSGGAVRYRLLETIRQYAAEKLEPASGAPAVQARHEAWCLELAEAAAPRLEGPEQALWLTRLEQEHENLRAALRRIVADVERREAGVRLAGALARFWRVHGHAAEGREWLERMLDDGCAFAPVLCVRALNGAGVLALEQGAHEQAHAYFERCLALQHALNDQEGVAAVLNSLGAVAWARGDYARARARFEQSLALRRDLDDQPGMARCLNNLGTLASDLGEYAEAWSWHEQSLALRRALNDHGGIAQSMHNLGEVAHRRGDHRLARGIWHQSLTVARDLGNIASVAGELGALARVAATVGEYQAAAELFAAAEAVRTAIRLPLSLSDRDRYAEGIDRTRAALGDAAFAAAQDGAQLIEVEDAIVRGLAWGPCVCGTAVAGIAPPEGARCVPTGYAAAGVTPGRQART